MRVYYDQDADLNLDQGQEGRGGRLRQLGHAHVLNMRGIPAQGTWWYAARRPLGQEGGAEGLKVMSVVDAARWADIVMMLTPDELQADTSTGAEPAPNMKNGAGPDVRAWA